MKTTYYINGRELNEGGVIIYNGEPHGILCLYDGTHVRLEREGHTEWLTLDEVGIAYREVPEGWHFNRIECRELRAGDIVDGRTCRVAGENPLFTEGVGIPNPVLRIPNPDSLDTMPMPAGHRIHDGVPQIKLSGRWVETTPHVAFLHDIAYDTRRQFVWCGALYDLADSVTLHDGYVAPRSYAVKATLTDGTKGWQLRSYCVPIDGVWYDRAGCWAEVGRDGNVIEWHAGEVPDDWAEVGRNRYADKGNCCCCEGNGEWYLESDGDEWDGEWYSNDWLSNNTFVCDGCGERYHNRCYGGGGCCEDCEDCEDRDDDDGNGVCDYSDKSANRMTPERDVPLKFGIELEVEPVDSRSRSIGAFGFPDHYCVLKEDGSLGGSGYEIVTRPDCPSVHKRVFGDMLSKPSVRTTTRSWQTGGRCGIHIHVSRKPLSDLWIGRMLVLVNSDNMRDIVHKVAGRYNVSYAGISRKKLKDGRNRSSRYDALNTGGDHTIEFRIFRGTLHRESFLKNIEFVEAVLAFCKPCTCSNTDVDSPSEFIGFLRKRRKDWPHLWDFLVTKGLATKATRA